MLFTMHLERPHDGDKTHVDNVTLPESFPFETAQKLGHTVLDVANALAIGRPLAMQFCALDALRMES